MNVLVTGAASGIGQAAKIAAVDLGPSPGLDGLIEELRALGAEAVALRGDMYVDLELITRRPSRRRR